MVRKAFLPEGNLSRSCYPVTPHLLAVSSDTRHTHTPQRAHTHTRTRFSAASACEHGEAQRCVRRSARQCARANHTLPTTQ